MNSKSSLTDGTRLLTLTYDYLRVNTTAGRTGRLTRLVNNLSHNKDRSYTYDAVGRLKQVTGGPTNAPLWTQSYTYDRYGNRTSVTASGHTASFQSPAAPQAPLPNTQLAWNSNGTLAVEALFGTEGQALSDSPNSLRLPPGAATTSRGAHAAASMSATDSEATQAGVPAKATPGTGAMLAVQGGTPVFTDDPLIAGVTPIKAVHLTELRTAVNQVRARAGLSAATWTDAAPQGLPIKAIHILELRQKLDEAQAALGLTNAPYTDPQLSAGSTIRAVHLQELRERVKSATTTALPVPRDGVATLAYEQATNRIPTTGYEYDAAGNQTRTLTASNTHQRYKYDAAGRLAQFLADDNQTVIASYSYSATNQRLLADEGGYRTYWVWSGSQVLAEYGEVNNSGVVQWNKSSVYMGARLLATLQPNGSGGEVLQYHHPDRLGTRLVSNAADTGYFEQVTLPYGIALEAESTGASSSRFTSYERSASSGLDYAVNRRYDSLQGRFTQVDPIGIGAASLSDPQSLNLYAYCGNDPIHNVDPDGLFSLKSALMCDES